MSNGTFDQLAEAYEAMVDWPRRLGNEEPLYRWLFERVGAKHVLDAACGTGHHAALFHSWGLEVQGADVSDAMIRWCQAHYDSSSDLRWVVRGFDQPVDRPGQFDVAICTGNSLALAVDIAMIDRAVQQMLAAVRPGGAVLVHVLNLWRMTDGPCQWQKCLRARLADKDCLVVKGVHRCGSRGYVDVTVTQLEASPPKMQSESVPFWGLEAGDLERMARNTGASLTEIYGGYGRSPYDRPTSQDLILLAMR